MTFPLTGPFVDVHSEVTPLIATNWGLWLNRAVDGTGGGSYIGNLTFSGDITLAGGKNILLNPRSIRREQDMLWETDDPTKWTRQLYNIWRNIAVGGCIQAPLARLLHGGTLNEVLLRWIGAGVHAAFPGGAPVMPVLYLHKVDLNGTPTFIGSQADTSATAGAYEAYHYISLTGLAEVIDIKTYRYVVTLSGETGGNFIANAEAASCRTEQLCSSYSEY